MMKKVMFKIASVFTLLFFISGINGASAQIANLYPNDSLIHNHPDVFFTEMFEHPTVNAMVNSTIPNYQTSAMTTHIGFSPSVPLGSHGTQSLKLTTVENSGALNDPSEDAYILKKFTTGINDSVFVRYYVKFNNAHTFHHTGVWIGGRDPANSCWPCNFPGRTIPTSGDSAFVVGTEIRGAANMSAQSASKFGFYNYWMDMKSLNTGAYYGNEFLSPNPAATIDMSEWNCVEIMLKLNNPVSDSTGELKIWINGQLLGHYGKGFPSGSWNQAMFNEGAGSPFTGFRWRSNPAVVFNYIWIKNYATYNAAYPSENDVLFDHVVVAKQYIGPIYDPQTSGLIEQAYSATNTVYPNPVNGILSLTKTTSDLIVFNAFNQKVLSAKNTNSISMANLPNGVYFIKTDDSVHKVIVNH